MNISWRLISLISILWCAVIIAPNNLPADESTQQWVGKIVSAQGQVFVKRAGAVDWQPVMLNELFYAGDAIRVEVNSRAGLRFSNESMLRVDQHTTLVFSGIEEKKTFLLELLRGAAYFFSRKSRSLKVTTPFVNGVVEGTEFLVQVDDEKTDITLFEGTVLAQNSQGEITMVKGQTITATQDQPPVLKTVIHPRDAVQWALYYPPIIKFSTEFFPITNPDDWTAKLHRSIQAMDQGEYMQALDEIKGLEDTVNDTRFYVYRAGLLLFIGRIDLARHDIEQALSLDDKNSTAMALQAIIDVVQNRKEDALQNARMAVHISPRSASARIALSYALQAHFDLEGALETVQNVVEYEPQNSLAWARLAELYLSTGDLDHALDAAKKAAAISPKMAHAQTVLGYAYLTQIKIKEAEEAFNQAITLDSAAPLPRLGLGLARIRQGHLQEGRSQLEIAVALDPDNALLRSYLGKAYFDEKREPLDERQFEIAESLDPKDPTPWFYDAIRKQTLNRPVEALQDLQQSIALNDNRAVYRSRLLLDQDRASRGASLARIYDDLGFNHVAQLEAATSLSLDPGNASAHRWLSDSYSSKPGHEIAQVSEQLQAQLFQSININPVPPSLIETDLSIIGSGPTGTAFNEYNALFERNRSQVLASGVWGNNGSWGDEIAVSGIYNQFSLSAGQFHYQTDGFRSNNDLDHSIYNFFAQMAVTPKLSLQAEWRRRITDRGDIVLNFDPDNYSDSSRLKLDRDALRIGARLNLTTKSKLIVSAISKNEEGELFQSTPGPLDTQITSDQDRKEEGYIGEIQYLYQSDSFNVIGGAGTSNIDVSGAQTVDMVPRLYPIFPRYTPQNYDRKHTNAYIYSNAVFPNRFKWTLGISFDSIKNDQIEKDKWNPKLGIQWQLTDAINIRGAAFKTQKKALILNQTIEPTQIAGFDQMMTDLANSEAIHYGLGLDYRIFTKLFTGFEIVQRDIDVIQLQEDFTEKWTERFYQVYANYIANKNVSIRFAPGLVEFKRDERGDFTINIPGDTETLQLPLSINWTSQRGFFTKFTATYVRQKIELPENSTFTSDEDDFTVVDTTFGYRLPNRIGMIQIEGHNIFDESFYFQDNNFRTADQRISPYVPCRSILGRVTLYF